MFNLNQTKTNLAVMGFTVSLIIASSPMIVYAQTEDNSDQSTNQVNQLTNTGLPRVIARNIRLKISQNWQGFEEENYHPIQPCNVSS